MGILPMIPLWTSVVLNRFSNSRKRKARRTMFACANCFIDAVPSIVAEYSDHGRDAHATKCGASAGLHRDRRIVMREPRHRRTDAIAILESRMTPESIRRSNATARKLLAKLNRHVRSD